MYPDVKLLEHSQMLMPAINARLEDPTKDRELWQSRRAATSAGAFACIETGRLCKRLCLAATTEHRGQGFHAQWLRSLSEDFVHCTAGALPTYRTRERLFRQRKI